MTAARGRVRFFLGAFGEPGHAFPMLALGAELAARGHEVTYETWSRWREHVEDAGMRFVSAPEYQLFPGDGEPFEMYEAVVRATGITRRAVADARPHVVVHDILTLAPAMAGELEGVPVATLIPHLYPGGAPGFPPYARRGSPSRGPGSAGESGRHWTRQCRRGCGGAARSSTARGPGWGYRSSRGSTAG